MEHILISGKKRNLKMMEELKSLRLSTMARKSQRRFTFMIKILSESTINDLI